MRGLRPGALEIRMRLNQIKLSGFKSFAEPTTFQLPGQRVGVVGPNGCGKSNIMDAVRWVLGESKASELRGESMQDVIFNGSGLRKPAGRASVELVFGNEDGRAGGAWGQYAEIAVKRVLTRDGNSSYYLNNQVVRRRDVQDVFMGTGLGPRAYAIIGQGTISRIIESRPEELRLFLEEAAGVSKYKERRRETEHRLRDTRENLTRVDDILRELGGNLDKLERQAETAQRFHALQAAGTLKLHQLWFLKHRDAAAEAERVRLAVQEATLTLEARLAELRHTEAGLEQTRQAHYAASDGLHVAQGELSEAALAVSRLEERIRYVVEGRQRAQARLAELQAQAAQWARARDDALAESADVDTQREAAEEQVAVLEAQAADAEAEAPQWEDALRLAQQRAQTQRSRAAQIQQQIQVLAAESRHVEEQLRGLRGRRERLAAERSGLRAPDLAQIEGLRAEALAAEAAQQETHDRLAAVADALPEAEERRRREQAALADATQRQAGVAARRDALQALQAKLQTQTKLQPWLVKHGLDALLPLWKRLHVEPGWEAAVESALRERLLALEVGRLETLAAFQSDAPPVKLSFFTGTPSARRAAEAEASVAETPACAPGALPDLVSKLRVHEPALQGLLSEWLHGIRVADDLAAALGARGSLGPGELVVTREGHAVSRLSVHFYAPDSEQSGLLARAQEIEHLTLDLAAQADRVSGLRATLVGTEAECAALAQQAAVLRREATAGQTRVHELQVQLLRLTQQSEAALARREQLQDELAEIDAQAEGLAERRAEGEARFEGLDMDLATAQEEQMSLEDAVTAAERRLGQAREQGRALERQTQEARFQARALASRLAELLRLERAAAQQIEAADSAAAQEQAELAAFDDAAAQTGLQDALDLRLLRERALAEARHVYDDLAQALRAQDEQRLTLEHGLAPLRERITALQLEAQAARLGGSQYMEQLVAAQADLALLAEGIGAGAVKLAGLQGEIDRIQREINGLGAVNLAALDELGTARERKQFLDAQNADLSDAIRTLEGAIHKIDLETRDLLLATFNKVNEGFGRMFPRLFGGGQARLVMTGDEVLDAGVQVMAQPPGKKNATIHLLSGGEKALTAIALVFAIFLLNPAPFCLLDEVDAPLDDANTERYARLVSEMSQGTQFLFISHNKIAMEMAQQLIGVTMQEQGVSRIVAVDMEAAVGLVGQGG